ncbi:hypothetical protein QZH41_015849 [Actinostola sp. cb2023]|nr:hypothetical protein QZH41_015849 [Actinostola sp. cb2023]
MLHQFLQVKLRVRLYYHLISQSKESKPSNHIFHLPTVKIPVFSGNPLEYPEWNSAFEALIDSREMDADTKLNLLNQYVLGSPKQVVEHYLLTGTKDAYVKAKSVLQERYGNSNVVSAAFLSKLEKWPKVGPEDASGLREFSDFLDKIVAARKTIASLAILDFANENAKLVDKLPYHLEGKWRDIITKWRTSSAEMDYPPFFKFADFVRESSDNANIPELENLSKLTTVNSTSYNKGYKGRSVSAFVTSATSNANIPKLENLSKLTTVNSTSYNKGYKGRSVSAFVTSATSNANIPKLENLSKLTTVNSTSYDKGYKGRSVSAFVTSATSNANIPKLENLSKLTTVNSTSYDKGYKGRSVSAFVTSATSNANIPELENLSKLTTVNSTSYNKGYKGRSVSAFVTSATSNANIPELENLSKLTTVNSTSYDKGYKGRSVSAFVTFATSNAQSERAEDKTTPSSTSRNLCLFCKEAHELNDCVTFRDNPFAERNNFIFRKRLCMICVKPTQHQAKDCKSKVTCKLCEESHPTCLHEEKPKEALASCTRVYNIDGQEGPGNAIIVPVWVRLEGEESNKILQYAVLDDQANVSFISETLCNKLNVTGPETKLKLTTVHEGNVLIQSRKIRGLEILDHNKDNLVKLPTAFRRPTIPANRSQIPKPEAVSQWKHLQQVSKELMPYRADIEVSLLIGSNCTRAIRPRQIIAGGEEEPCGQKTIHGWGVIGRICKSTSEDNNLEANCHLTNVNENNHFVFHSKAKEIFSTEAVIKVLATDFNEYPSQEKPYSVQDKRSIKAKEVYSKKWRRRVLQYMANQVWLRMADKTLDKNGKRRQPATLLDRPIHKLVLLMSTEDQSLDSSTRSHIKSTLLNIWNSLDSSTRSHFKRTLLNI